MEKFVYYNYLFDIYKAFISEKNAQIFSYYYSENLSMQEIADILAVSKSFVGSTIKRVEKKLDLMESELGILKLRKKLEDISNINDIKAIKKEIAGLLDN